MMKVRLLKEIEKFGEVIPVLKYVRGEVFGDKHWKEMYLMIGIPQHVPVEKLTFGEVIKVCSWKQLYFKCEVSVNL